MSIRSLLASSSESSRPEIFTHPRQSQTASYNEVSIASLLTSDTNKRRWGDHDEMDMRLGYNSRKALITCLHASVAQKSYGSEKRFLCPPPMVHMQSPSGCTMTPEQRSEKMLLSMSVVCENGEKILEQRSLLDENQSGSFKYLHVTGTAKAKQFCLNVNLLANSHTHVLASFSSKPISIISKPSKKTAKTRNVSTCILANSPVSLFNRINSQTVRTKYMTSSNNKLCAKNATWSPFDIIIVNQPKQPIPAAQNRIGSRFQQPSASSKAPIHITYGTEIILRDSQTGVSSPPLIIRKVDKGRIAPCAYGPVSQMQKIALQLSSSINSQPVYLSAAGSMSDNSISSATSDHHSISPANSTGYGTWIDHTPSRIIHPEQNSLEMSYEEVDDYLCWTIVGIAKFEFEYYENDVDEQIRVEKPETEIIPPVSPPRCITPFPILTSIHYNSGDHTLDVIGQHLIQAAPVPRLLDLWLGTHGPLVTRISQPPQSHTPHETHWSVSLPSTKDLLIRDRNSFVTHPDGSQTLELALLLVRQDGLVYHSGKALSYDVTEDTGCWQIVAASSS
ncbi:beta-trefoil [Backusella circina FSU 941]|nr:beta-trefoil [Backusella circina FSU 941]